MGNAIQPVLVAKSQDSIPQYSIIPVFHYSSFIAAAPPRGGLCGEIEERKRFAETFSRSKIPLGTEADEV
jgi:hypothetical protein